MICLWVLLTAATNLAQDVSDVDVLTSLPSQSLECSLKFDRDFIASNEELALALETLMEGHTHDESAGDRRHDSSSDEETPEDSIADNEETPVLRRQLGRSGHRHRRERNGTAIDSAPTRRPRDNSASDSSDDFSEAGATRPPRGDRRHDSSDSSEQDAADVETTEAAVETEETPLLRRLLERKNRHQRRERNATRDNSASDSSSRDSSEEYADIETPEAGATRPPRGDRRHDSSDSSSRDSSEDVADETTEVDVETTEAAVETEETPLLRRVLKRRRGDNSASDSSSRDSSEEHVDIGTPEAGATRPPRGDRRHDSSDSSSDSSEDVVAVETTDVDVETTEAGVETEETPLLRRVLGRKDRRSRDNSASDSSSRDSSEEHADVGTLEAGATRRPRDDSSSSDSSEDVVAAETTEVDVETTETPLLRRALRRGKDHGRRRSRGVSATISNGSVQVAGLTGEVVFGDVDAELQTIPLAITFGETSFSCDVALRDGNKVFCRASSAEDEFHLRVGCEIPADEE